MKRNIGNTALKREDAIEVPRRNVTPKAHLVRAMWEDLERLGLGKIAMKEQISAHRALVNATSGALTVKKKPEDKKLKDVKKALLDLVREDDDT